MKWCSPLTPHERETLLCDHDGRVLHGWSPRKEDALDPVVAIEHLIDDAQVVTTTIVFAKE
jgi:hypothetical protein